MSNVYIRRVRAIRLEFEAARQAITYVQRHWQKYNIYIDLNQLNPADFAEAGTNVEQTYFIRLFAEFEGILRDHLTTNHTSLVVPDKPKIDWLVSRVAKSEVFKVNTELRRRLDDIRDYRNSVAHRTQAAVPAIPLVNALSTFTTILAKLPDPLS